MCLNDKNGAKGVDFRPREFFTLTKSIKKGGLGTGDWTLIYCECFFGENLLRQTVFLSICVITQFCNEVQIFIYFKFYL